MQYEVESREAGEKFNPHLLGNMATNMDDLEVYLLVKTAGWYYTSLFYRNLSARICSLYYFLLEGILTGIWSVALSTIQSNLDLSDSALGYAVLFSALGTAVTAPITAFLMRRFGIQKVVLCAGVAYSAFLPLLAVSDSFGLLSFTMFVFGLAWGMTDICANSSAVLTEIVAGKAILGSFHGSYSLAAASGSLIGALMTSNGVSILTMFLIFFAICGTLSVVFSVALYDKEQEHQIAIYNNKMTQLQNATDAAAAESNIEGTDEEDPQETVNEILLGFDASELRDNRTQEEIDAQLMEDRTHITYTTDWKSDPNLCRYSEEKESNLETPLLAPLIGPGNNQGDSATSTPYVSPRHPRFPRPARSALLSEEIGSYQVRTNSFVSIVEPVNPYLLLHLCCLCFLAAFGEGGLVTWTVIYFEKVLNASSVSKSAGYICFMVAMAVGRFCCDYLRRAVGRRMIVFVGGLLASSGLMVVFAVSALPSMAAIVLSCMGLCVTGFGLSTLLPISFSSAGHLTEVQHSGSAVATTAVCAYCGSILASPLVGVISDLSGSLHYGFLLIAIVVGLIVPVSYFIPGETSRIMNRTEV